MINYPEDVDVLGQQILSLHSGQARESADHEGRVRILINDHNISRIDNKIGIG